MVTESEISEMIGKAKEGAKKLKFKQSVELIMTFKDIDVKKGFAINETVQLAKTSARHRCKGTGPLAYPETPR